MASIIPPSNSKEDWIRVFCPDVRSVSAAEISSEERRRTEAGDEGVWLEVRCPRDKCLTGEDKMTISVRGIAPREEEGLWHKLFCPEDRCFAESSVDIPS